MDLFLFVKIYYRQIFDKHKFTLYDRAVGPGMGESKSYVGHGMVVRIINDRDQYFVSIGNEVDKRYWWNLDFIMSFFKMIDENPDNKKDREKILCETFSWRNYGENANYFDENFYKIKSLFTDNFENKLAELRRLDKERGKFERLNKSRRH